MPCSCSKLSSCYCTCALLTVFLASAATAHQTTRPDVTTQDGGRVRQSPGLGQSARRTEIGAGRRKQEALFWWLFLGGKWGSGNRLDRYAWEGSDVVYFGIRGSISGSIRGRIKGKSIQWK